MKKLSLVLLTLLSLLLVLTGCSSADKDADGAPVQNEESNNGQESVSQEDAEEQPEDSATQGKGTLGDYEVEITGARLLEDYEGKPAIIVSYTWTNNSEETTSAFVAFSTSAFQDGVELDTAVVTDDSYDGEADMKDIRPGASLEAEAAYLLDSETAVVEFEISELFSFDDTVVTTSFDPSGL